jgi:uncharacterized membrane protein
MHEFSQPHPLGSFGHHLEQRVNRASLWLSKHWLAAANLFFLTYVGLPFLAPLLLTAGYPRAANAIYQMYNFTCHQFPSRAYFLTGEQVCMCHRCVAMYGTIFLGGLVYGLLRPRLKPLSFRWYLLFLVPIGLDGGLALLGELTQVVPTYIIAGLGLGVLLVIGLLLYKQKQLTWSGMLMLFIGLLAVIYVQFFGPHHSNYLLRTITGFIFGVGTVWFVYPMMDEAFGEAWRATQAKLAGQARL